MYVGVMCVFAGGRELESAYSVCVDWCVVAERR